MSKRYCFFTANYLPKLGGVEVYTHCLAKALVKRGNEVTIITLNEKKTTENRMENDVRIIEIPGIQAFNGRLPLMRFNKAFRMFDRSMKKHEFDLVIVQTRYYPLSVYGARYAKRKSIPCILLDHSTNHINIGGNFVNKMFEIYEHVITKVLKAFDCKFLGVSQACNEWLKHFRIVSQGVLYNSIEYEVAQSSEKQDICKKYGIPANVDIILYAGRLLKEKGIEKLVEAFRELKKEYPELYLVVAGDGELYDRLSGCGDDNCIWLGRVKHDEVLELMKKSLIFCLPSDYPEGFPTSVLEAAVCRCYTITTTAGGSKELITSLEYGTVLEQNQSSEVLKKAIEYVLDNPEHRKRAVNNNYDRVLKHFTWNVRADEVEDITEKGIVS
ncbi:glycosyltransferase family 4 protein [Faecalicatena contorta]|uniref:Glycosyltransferase involved in cell wall bisynthesis n=1 Tax=Faecalicatena contorta TaxID=39482 RepID=A0A315ZST1_9FIRM|nr:glycosyltransferase family 4 protein [Faecalicatena contorta]PWJ48369.1 glycosyltransferase involved in cell wall biosynthesis [Faecalicatena contorta]SUQ15392.1 Glycosyltransferase involved in cell wall bisynthesis [Faecalicatena contorta]